jgi:hypothetical protein
LRDAIDPQTLAVVPQPTVRDTLHRVTANHGPAEPSTALQAAYDFAPARSDYVSLLRSMPQLRVLKLVTWFMLATFAVALSMSMFLVTADGEPAIDPLLLLVLAVPVALCTLVAFGYAPLGGRLAWREPANREPVHAVLDGEGFRHEGPSGSQNFVWSVAAHALETDEAYYVYVSNGVASLVYWLPKRAVPVGEQTSVRAHIQAHVRRYRIRS